MDMMNNIPTVFLDLKGVLMNNLLSKMLGCTLVSTLLPLQFAYAQIEKDLPKNHTVSLTFMMSG